MSNMICRAILFALISCILSARSSAQTNTFPTSGNVGIGTTSPGELLQIGDSSSSAGSRRTLSFGIGGYANPSGPNSQSNGDKAVLWNTSIFKAAIGVAAGTLTFQSTGASNGIANIQFFTGDSGTANSAMLIDKNGHVGIGTSSPGSALEVNGNVKLSSGSGASMTFADGTVQSTAWSGTLCGGDYAETVDAAGERASYEPGDVLVISEGATDDISKSAKPYSPLVAGIYSTKPGVVGRRQTGERRDREIPMAMVGIVPTKVSAENGSIKKGDLLVTSSMPGYAMKGTDRTRMLGAVVGKALGNLDSNTGVIEVLVTLQ